MDALLTLLKVLFISRFVLVTPAPVTIEQSPLVVELDKPVKAVMDSAAVEVDVTSIFFTEKGSSREASRIVDNELGYSDIEARLYTEEDEFFVFSYNGSISVSGERVLLHLVSAGSHLKGRRFVKMTITSDIELKDVMVYWVKYTM